VRPAFATSALVEKDDAIDIGIEEAPHLFGTTAARAAVQEHGRLSMRVAGFFIVELVPVAYVQKFAVVGFDRRIKNSARVVFIHPRIMEGSIPEYHTPVRLG